MLHPGHDGCVPLLTSFASLTGGHRHLIGLAHLLSSRLDRLDDVDIASTTAKVAGDALAYLLLAWVRITLQQGNTGHHHARGAIATLEGVHLVKPFLHRMELPVLLQTLNCHKLATVGLDGEHGAGFGGFAIDQNGAGSARGGIAANM